MSRWEAVYTDPQRDAVERAWLERGIRPARRVAALAAAGELEGLDPFTIPEATVRDIGRRARKRQAGEVRSALAQLPHRDAINTLRVRLLAASDRELERLERRQRAGRDVPGEELRQIARAVRELAALPGPDDPRPVPPGQRDPARQGPDKRGERNGGPTRGGLAGAILRDVRQGDATVPIGDRDTPGASPRPDDSSAAAETHERDAPDAGSSSATPAAHEEEAAEQTPTPGPWPRAMAAPGERPGSWRQDVQL